MYACTRAQPQGENVPRYQTGHTAEELEDLMYLGQRITADYRDPDVGPMEAFTFAQTSDNAKSSFWEAIKLAKRGKIRSLGISDGTLGHGYDGYDASVLRLKELGWQDLVPIYKVDVGGGVNTRSEALKLCECMQANGALDVDLGVIAPPFHILRAFMTAVTVFEQAGCRKKIFAVPGVPLPWKEEVRHSQGTTKGTRADLLAGELDRLKMYQEEKFGGMFTAKRVLEYLDWRDR